MNSNENTKPRFQFTDVEGAARQISDGLKNWLELADYLRCARNWKQNKKDGCKNAFFAHFDGAQNFAELRGKLGLTPNQSTMLVKGIEQAMIWNRGKVEKCLDDRKSLDVGYSNLYRASLCRNRLEGEKKVATEAVLKEKFESGTLTFADVQVPKPPKSSNKPDSYAKVLEVAKKNKITAVTLKRLIKDYLDEQTKAEDQVQNEEEVLKAA